MTKQTKIQESREGLKGKIMKELGGKLMKDEIYWIIHNIEKIEKVVREEERERIVEVLEGMKDERTVMDEKCKWCEEKFCGGENLPCDRRTTHNKALNQAIKIIKNIDKQG